MPSIDSILPNQRHLFDIPDDVAYLNCAYMSPLLNAAVEAGKNAVVSKQRPWNITSADFFDPPDVARNLFAQLIGAGKEDVAIVPAVSYGIEVARLNTAIAPGQEILLLQDQFPSNVYPWAAHARDTGASVVTVAREAVAAGCNPGTLTERIVAAINPQTAVVALPNCHWVDGVKIDLVTVAKAARQVGAALVLDLAQSAGVVPVNVQEIQPDFLVAPTYKWLLGPYSMGFLYVAPHRQSGRPLEHNWIGRKGAEDFSSLVNYQEDFAAGARRFDMGERSQMQLLPMAIAALEQILHWGVKRIEATVAETTRYIAERAEALGLESTPEHIRCAHYLGLKFPRGLPAGLHQRLAEHGVYVSIRGDRMRITPHVYNTQADSDRLIETLKIVL